YIAGACACLMFVGVGVGYYGLAVFLKPLQEDHGWSNSVVSGATGLYFSLSGISAAIVGPRIDRHGPTRFMITGVLISAAAAACIGYVNEIWQLYAVYSVLAIAFGMSSGVATNAIMTRWFVRRRARAMSISATGVSAGGAILSPLAAGLVDAGGLELATPVMALLVLAVALPVITLVIAWDPRQMGLRPDGLRADETVVPGVGQLAEAVQLRRWTLREAMKTPAFWGVLIAFLLVLTAQTGFVIHQISFLEDRLGSRSAAAFALSVTAIGSIVARLIVGTFADAVDKRVLTVALLAIQGTAVLLLIPIEGRAATYLLILVFGFTIGNVYMMQSLLVGEIFGMVSFGAIFGVVSMAGQIGSGFGPLAVGWMEDQTGSYSLAFVVSALVTYSAAAAIFFARPASLPEAPGPTPG
ncbi:MAG: MFS transporter, partial [Tepidiformaceae bacterium]